MNCNEVKKIMAEFVQGDLPEKESGDVQVHIDSCPECRYEYEAFIKTWDILDEWKAVEPSPDFTARFLTKVMAQEKPARTEHNSIVERLGIIFRNMFTFRVPAWSAALLIAAAIFLAQYFNPPQVVERVVYREVPVVETADYTIPSNPVVAGGSTGDYLPSPYTVLKNTQKPEATEEEEIFEQQNKKTDGTIERIDLKDFI
ncbi:MAG: zf-HC2 domain-containing protein [Firmicutes bacterium]|nr:zf-HC2 domain-containing protein [Bacillota bacterium]